MDVSQYLRSASERGYPDPAPKTLDAGTVNERHAHDESLFVFVEAGEFFVEIFEDGRSSTTACGPGDTIEVPAGVEHAESVGSNGAKLLVARRA